ncbi:MAG: apolipoprotein N-acyltransferase [Deferribacteraceae bacterium]|jgi:apolipoprotein N-acyltransferase|nr:apolipoprotein N-acyltransferase [Deferribacteraceae bacterium]
MVKELLLCILAAGLLVLASPGMNIWPLAFVAFALIFWILDRAKAQSKPKLKQAKAMFLIGFVFYLFTTMWIQVPATVFGGAPQAVGLVIVFAVAALSALLFWMPLGLVAKHTNNSIFLFALVLVALELLKAKYYLGGVPWLNIGQTQYNNLLSLQLASIIGENGLSFLVVLGGGCLYKLVTVTQKSLWIKLSVAILLLLFGYGGATLYMDIAITPTSAATVRLVQTGIAQQDKWAMEKRQEVYDTLIAGLRTAATKDGDYDLLLLPESTFNVNPFTSAELWPELVAISQDHGVLLSHDRNLQIGGERTLYNTMSLLANGSVQGVYDKMKLAPFGEYFPFEEQLKPIKEFFFGSGIMFTPGEKPVVFEYNDLRIAPLICFEASFTELIRTRVAMGANVLAVASNESWFGESLGRYQRLAMDVLRAAEYNKYLLRSTQDGISTVIDPQGRLVTIFPEKVYHVEDIAFAPMNGQTIFARFGYGWFLAAMLGYAVLVVRKRKSGR